MTSQARINANRQKALRSTGPRTEAGKAQAVMSRRLAEQVFDMLFENPPVALGLPKGSPKLSELKVLPDPARARASRAGESAARSDRDVKNAENEANGHETQLGELQKDTAHNPESGGEKRTQPRIRIHSARVETKRD